MLTIAAPLFGLSVEMILGLLSLYAAITALVFAQAIGADLGAYKNRKSRSVRNGLIFSIVAFFLAIAFIAIIEPSNWNYETIVIFLQSPAGLVTFAILCLPLFGLNLIVFIRRLSYLR